MMKKPVTTRMQQEGVTARMPEEKEEVTSRMPEGEQGATSVLPDAESQAELRGRQSYSGITTGDLIVDRYRVIQGPLGEASGEADVFECLDTELDSRVALKVYRPNISPKSQIPKRFLNLDHPDIVSLKGFDNWQGHFFEVMEFCEGGSFQDYLPYTEQQLWQYLPEFINGLKYCHDQGVIHRDIKPGNLFFRHAGQKDVVIGDFGISSVLEDGEQVRVTGTSHNYTPDYAAPELIDGKKVSDRTDYYALGITLIHLLNGKSPFYGMNIAAIQYAHREGIVPRPEALSSEIGQLIAGLLRKKVNNRWGYHQVMAWLNHEVILADDGKPDQEEVYAGREHPYPKCKDATTPVELAQHLDQFDSQGDLFRGNISQWVLLHFEDAELADRIVNIEENYTDNKSLGLFVLRFTLDPSLPLSLDGEEIYTISDLVAKLNSSDDSMISSLGAAFWDKRIECWIEMTKSGSAELLGKIRGIRSRLENSNYRRALFALLYTLDPSQPFTLQGDLVLHHPDDVEDVIANNPEGLNAIGKHLALGSLEEWLKIAFSSQDNSYDYLKECQTIYQQQSKELGVYALRWHLNHEVSFPFQDKPMHTPVDLAKTIDASSQNWTEGEQLLLRGWIKTWLLATGRLSGNDSRKFDEVVENKQRTWPDKLEAVLHLLDPEMPWPDVTANRRSIDVGRIGTETKKTVQVVFRNQGRGYLAGTVSLNGSGNKGIALKEEYTLEGGPETVKVDIDPSGLPAGSLQQVAISAKTNGGNIEIPLTYRVAAPLVQMILRSIGAGLLCAIALFFFRLIVEGTVPASLLNWNVLESFNPTGEEFPVIILMAILVAMVGGGITYLVRMNKAMKNE